MQINKITNRNIVFTTKMTGGFDLNLGLILGDKHNFIIDTGMGSQTVQPIVDYIKNDDKPVIVINTHYHWDHIWGNCAFPNSLIISHELCRTISKSTWEAELIENKQDIHGDTSMLLPNLTFRNAISFPDDSVEIFFTPGHTKDCISVYDKTDEILYAGDNIGDFDYEIVPNIETDLATYKKTLDIYKNLDFKTCISGHNVPQDYSVISRIEKALIDKAL